MRMNWREVSETGTLQIKALKNFLNQRYCVSSHDVGFQQAPGAYPGPGGGSSQVPVRYLSGVNLDG